MDNQKSEIVEIVDTKIIYLSTKSSSGTLLNGDMKSHVLYDLRSYLNYDSDNTVQKITISMPYVLIVNSNYIINQNNCTLIIQTAGPTVSTYTFPFGNYTANSFIGLFSSIVTGYSISINIVTNKFTITHPTSAFTILGTSTIDYIMGFSDDLASSVVGSVNSATSPRVCNFLPNASFQICTVGGMLYNGIVLDTNGAAYGNVLCSVPNSSTNNTQLVYNGSSEEFQLQGLGQSKLEIAILDNSGYYVDFNGCASFMCLKVKVYRNVERLVGSFSDVLKMPIFQQIKTQNVEE
jgi:hypothetical protein